MPFQMYVNGAWIDAEFGRTNDVLNPATGEIVARAAYGGVTEGNAAMDAAERAFPTWWDHTAYERGSRLTEAAATIRNRSLKIARVLTQENGKPLAEALAETNACAAWLDWFAEEGKRVYDRMIPSQFAHKRHWVLHQPVGPVLAISPWNFPISLMSRKLAAALAAGCTIVCRPASQTPLSSMLLFECLEEAGFPEGVIGLVTGPAEETTKAMLSHPACRKLTFTGSTSTGKQLMKLAGERIIKLSLELGGHAPLLVFPDVDLEQAAELTVAGKFRNAGQSCIAPTRVYVHERILDEFTEIVIKMTAEIQVGNGLAPGTTMGPLFNKRQVQNQLAFVDDARAKGANVLMGGHVLEDGQYSSGHYFAPTVITDVDQTMNLTCDEVFGPILPLYPFSDEEDVIERANGTEYGLAAYVLVRDFATAIRVTEQLEYGVVGLNDTVPTVPQAPFGGWKQSGIGSEGGSEGIHAYMQPKYLSVALD